MGIVNASLRILKILTYFVFYYFFISVKDNSIFSENNWKCSFLSFSFYTLKHQCQFSQTIKSIMVKTSWNV